MELGRAIGEFARTAVDREPAELAQEYDLDERAARNLVSYLREQREATRVVPSDRTIVIERFRDEIGDWRLCVLSPFGGRVHAAWGLALSARIRDRFGLESDAIWSDDGIVVHLPDADEPPGAELVMVEPDELEELVVRELSSSALYGARFRENAARALLLPRAYPGKRTPLWQQRLKAQSLLEVAKGYGQFPIVLETYRECLRDVLDLPALEELLRGLHRRELSLVEAETQRASPFASSLLFDYVATYMYEGDTPNAERRAAALSLDRDLLRELLGQEELRDLIDPAALAEVEADLQRLSERTRAANSDGLHDVLRAVGDLTTDEAQARCLAAVSAKRMLNDLEAERRAVSMRIGGEQRWIASEDAGLYRDAFGAVPPGGLPAAFLEEQEDPMGRLVRRFARTHGPFATRELGDRYALDPGPVLRELERAGDLVRASSARAARSASGATPRCCAACGEPRWRRCARRSSPPSSARWPGSCRPGRASTPRRPAAPEWTGCARCWCRSREWRWPPRCGSATCCRGAPARTRRPGSTSSAHPGSWCGWAPDRSVAAPARSPCCSARTRAGWVRRRSRPNGRPSRCTRPSGRAWRPVRRSGRTCWPTWTARIPIELQEALWDLVWVGEVTNDAFAPLRAPRLALAREQRDAGRRFARRRRPGAPQVQGRWSLTARLFADAPQHGPRMRAVSEVLLERYGIVTRETVLAEGIPGGFASLYSELANLETLGTARRGYFVEGLGGAQFALPAAIERLRGLRADEPAGPLVLAATDPANPFGATLPWPRREGSESGGRRPSRVPGAYVVTLDAEPVLYVERGGKGLVPLRDAFDASGQPEPWLPEALEALADHVRARTPAATGARALRRRAGRGVGARGAAGADRLPPGPAPPNLERMMLVDTRDERPERPPAWEPNWRVWWRGTAAAILGVAAFSTGGLVSVLLIFAAVYFACRTVDEALPYPLGLTEWRQ